MIYQTLSPDSPLSLAVESIWIYSGYRPPHFFERVLPSGTMELIVQLEDIAFRCYDADSFELRQVMRGPLLAGARTEVQIIDTAQQLNVMGVHFRPGGIRSLFAMPADEIAGLDVPVDTVWCGFGAQLHERLAHAATPAEKLRVMEGMLLARIDPGCEPHPAVPAALNRIERADEPFGIGALATELGLSSRRFIEVFTSHVGLTPKAYSRLRRFQRGLRAIHRSPRASWAEVAFSCGWYDQAHMIRDFKEFSGITPAEYRSLNDNWMLHVPILERGQICPIPEKTSVAGWTR